MMRSNHRCYWALALVWSAAMMGCGGDAAAPAPTPAASPQMTSFAGTLPAGGSAAHPFIAERSGTLTATMTTSAPLDITFFVARSGIGCTRTDRCPFLVAPNASKRMTYIIAKGESIALILWHALDENLGEARDYSIEVVVQ